MKKLVFWNSGRDEMRKIPIICPNPECLKQIQVGGSVEDGELAISNCTACGTPISAALYVGEPDDTEELLHPVTATVTWTVGNSTVSERTTKFGPTMDIPSTLLTVLGDGVQFFRNPDISTHELYELLVRYIVANILPAEQLEEILKICSERMKTPTVVEEFTVIKSNGNNGVTRHSSDNEAKEDTDDDE